MAGFTNAGPRPDRGDRRPGSVLRGLVWVLHVSVPVLVLWLVLAEPGADLTWQHNPSHLWLVLAAALVGAVLSVLIATEGARRDDARLALVGFSYVLATAGLGIHALATPKVIVDGPTAAFSLATPIGLVGSAAVALIAGWVHVTAWRPSPKLGRDLSLAGLALTMVVSVLTVAGIGPWAATVKPPEVVGEVKVVSVIGGALFVVAALGFWSAYRRRNSAVTLGVLTSYVVLAEAFVAAGWGRNWQISWWIWHVLILVAFLLVAYVAGIQGRRDGSTQALFQGVAMQETVDRLRDDYGHALEAVVATMDVDRGGVDRMSTGDLTSRFDLSDGQADVVMRAAAAVRTERELQRRLQGLVDANVASTVATDEATLLREMSSALKRAFQPDGVELWLVRDDELIDQAGRRAPASYDAGRTDTTQLPRGVNLYPLRAKGQPIGVLEVTSAGDLGNEMVSLHQSMANQVGLSIENSRLYDRVEGLFGTYMSTDVADAMLSDPSRSELGGREQEVTVLFADLSGFISFSEKATPSEVVDMLNRSFDIAVPAVIDAGGTVTAFMGDALMATFGAPIANQDHAVRAIRAALDLVRLVGDLADTVVGHPRFRCGLASGPALVGNIGSANRRQYTAIGDTTNLAARLEGVASEGEVVISARTLELAADRALVESMGEIAVKGKAHPVEVHRVLGLR